MALTALSLFAGAGGLDVGVEQAGFDVIFALENNPVAVQTLNRNRGTFFKRLGLTESLDITQTNPRSIMREFGVRKGDVDLLVGGPPCVAFSKSGFHLEYKREGRDPRAGLLYDYLRFLDELRPPAFLLENVFGLLYRNHSAPFFDGLIKGIASLGYTVSFEVLNAADYGVPQNRQRLFVVGSLGGKKLRLPAPTHWGDLERRVRPAHAASALPHVTAGEVLCGLRTTEEPEESVNGRYGHLLPYIPPGGNYLFFTEHEGHRKPLFKWRSRYWTFLLKLDPKRPASTIQGQPGPYVGPFHWENRRLRVPELKRLQSFPDNYEFAGSRRDVQLQVGNSVPPLLARCVGEVVRRQLGGETILPPPSRQLGLL